MNLHRKICTPVSELTVILILVSFFHFLELILPTLSTDHISYFVLDGCELCLELLLVHGEGLDLPL